VTGTRLARTLGGGPFREPRAAAPKALGLAAQARVREWQKFLGVNVSFDVLPNAPRWLATLARRIVPTLPASGFELESLLKQLGLAVR
jgi:hypothetical protein